jgi:hypothetical protein
MTYVIDVALIVVIGCDVFSVEKVAAQVGVRKHT